MARSAHILIACAAGLLALGVLMVHSAGSSVGGPLRPGGAGAPSGVPATRQRLDLSRH